MSIKQAFSDLGARRTRQDWVYFIGAAWFGVVCAILGFNVTTWEFYLVMLSYVAFASELLHGRRTHA